MFRAAAFFFNLSAPGMIANLERSHPAADDFTANPILSITITQAIEECVCRQRCLSWHVGRAFGGFDQTVAMEAAQA